MTHDAYWKQGQQAQAVQACLSQTNSPNEQHNINMLLQAALYLHHMQDYPSRATLLEHATKRYPQHTALWDNLLGAYYYLRDYPKCASIAERCSQSGFSYGIFARAYFGVGQLEQARHYGRKALETKKANANTVAGWTPPATTVHQWLNPAKTNVVAFSLWGNNTRYTLGIVDNLLACQSLLPNWTMRVYVDNSVNAALCTALEGDGAQVVRMPDGGSLFEKLSWRFLPASDPTVGRFLSRDSDSTISPREAALVEEWCASGKWFHVIRDWWSHTDVVLAGLWGGVANVLPMQQLLAQQAPDATNTVDQRFLLQWVWPFMQHSVLEHDRCFGPNPQPTPNYWHIGQNEQATDAAAQQQRVRPWLERHGITL